MRLRHLLLLFLSNCGIATLTNDTTSNSNKSEVVVLHNKPVLTNLSFSELSNYRAKDLLDSQVLPLKAFRNYLFEVDITMQPGEYVKHVLFKSEITIQHKISINKSKAQAVNDTWV